MLSTASVLSFRPCAVLEVGALRGDGVGLTVHARRNDALWVAAGFSVHADVELVYKLYLELELGGSAPLNQPRFLYTNGTVAFETPSLGLRSSLVLALRL